MKTFIWYVSGRFGEGHLVVCAETVEEARLLAPSCALPEANPEDIERDCACVPDAILAPGETHKFWRYYDWVSD